MEEMNKLNTENAMTEVVEEVTNKITFKENLLAYTLSGVFVTGLATISYLGYKGVKRLSKKVRNKKEEKVDLKPGEVIDVDDESIHEVNED